MGVRLRGLDKIGGLAVSALRLCSDTREGAAGMAKLSGQINKYWYEPNPPHLEFTLVHALNL